MEPIKYDSIKSYNSWKKAKTNYINSNSKYVQSVSALEEHVQLRGDDEFEEFEPEHWSKAEQEEETTQQWMDNWDDDLDDDFTKNLREELTAAKAKQ